MAAPLGAGIVAGAIDPAIATIVVAALGFAAAVVTALIGAWNNRKTWDLEQAHARDQRRIRALLIQAGLPPEALDDGGVDQ